MREQFAASNLIGRSVRLMIRPILRYGESLLHQPASNVDAVDDGVQRLIDDMIETMYAAPGVGLAATQIGVPLRHVRHRPVRRPPPRDVIVMINPAFVEREGMQLEEEGCLSVPGFNATVVRPARAVVRASIGTGAEQTIEGQRPARAGVSARDGSSRWHALRRSPARNQARPDRPEDP